MKTRDYIRKTIAAFILMFIMVNVFPQGVKNNGGKIVMDSGSYLTIIGSGFANASSNGDGTVDNDGTILLEGNFSNTAGGNVFINQDEEGIVEFNGTTQSTITGSASFENLIINNLSGVKLINTNTVNKSLTLTKGMFNLNSKILSLADGIVLYRTGGSISATPSYIGVVDIVYNEYILLIETGDELPGDVNTIRDLTINTSNGVQLFKDITINRTLDFDAGKIELLVYDLKLAQNARITGYDETKYIIAGGINYVSGAGRLSRFIKNTTASADQVFPIGSATSYTPCYISTLNSIGTYYNINLFGKVMEKGTNGIQITSQVINRTWDIVPDNEPNATPTTLKLQWNGGDEATNFQSSSISISKNRHIAGVDESWTELTGTITRQIDTAPYWVMVDGISSFSNFAGGTRGADGSGSSPLGGTSSPLPISLLSFSASCDGESNILTWSTATETNNDYFTIEKSINAIDWVSIGLVEGAGNSNEQKTYSFTDDDNASTFYYRLKQTDFNGQYSYLGIAYSEPCFTNKVTINSIYPNPFNDNITLCFNSISDKEIIINVVDMNGNKVIEKAIKVICGENLVMLNLSDIEKGTYLLYLSNSPNESYKIVKQ